MIPELLFSWTSLLDFTTLPLADSPSVFSQSRQASALPGSDLSPGRGSGSGSLSAARLVSFRRGALTVECDCAGTEVECASGAKKPPSSSSSMSHASLVLRANSWNVAGFFDLMLTAFVFGASLRNLLERVSEREFK